MLLHSEVILSVTPMKVYHKAQNMESSTLQHGKREKDKKLESKYICTH